MSDIAKATTAFLSRNSVGRKMTNCLLRN